MRYWLDQNMNRDEFEDLNCTAQEICNASTRVTDRREAIAALLEMSSDKSISFIKQNVNKVNRYDEQKLKAKVFLRNDDK